MKHILEFAKFIDKNSYMIESSDHKYSITDCSAYISLVGDRIIISVDFDYHNFIYIVFNTTIYTITIDYYDTFVLTDESQNRLINNILNNDSILNEFENLIFKHAPDTSIEEFKELLKNVETRIIDER